MMGRHQLQFIKNFIHSSNKYSTKILNSTAVADFEAIPAPKGLPLVGTSLSLLLAGPTNLHNYIDRRHKELGTIFRDNVGPIRAVFISDPKLMRKVFAEEGKYPMHVLPEAWLLYNKIYGCQRGLFFMNGEEWWHHRKIMNKLLLKGDFKWMENACEFVSEQFVQLIKNANGNIDLQKSLYKWSLDIMFSALLGVEMYKLQQKNLRNYENLATIIQNVFLTSIPLTLFPATLAAKFHLPIWKRFVTAVDKALILTNELVDELMRTKIDDKGLLGKMLKEDVSLDNIKKIIVDLILAAGDTTAHTMEWTLYSISKQKEIQHRLRRGLQTEYAPSLLKNIIKESLRLYPVAPFLTRIMPHNVIINNYNIPANTLIVMSIYTSGRDANIFKNPEEFNPDRWLRDNNNSTSEMQQATLPFAMGKRSCIGRKLAEIQLNKTLVEIIRAFDVEVCNNNEIQVILKLISVPSEPVRLKFHSVN